MNNFSGTRRPASAPDSDLTDDRWQRVHLSGEHFKTLLSTRSASNWLHLLKVHAGSLAMTVWRSSSSVTLVCLGVSLFLAGPCQAGCRETGQCCAGREPSCVSKGWRSDRSYGTCYCDQACVSTLDCCHDYETACPGGFCADCKTYIKNHSSPLAYSIMMTVKFVYFLFFILLKVSLKV